MKRIELQNRKGRIATQFVVSKQRYSLYGLGNWDSGSDKAKAEALIRVIEGDILEHRFDTTLERYKGGLLKATKSLGTVTEMFAQWVEHLGISEKTYRVHYEPVFSALLKTGCKLGEVKAIEALWGTLKPSSYNGRIGYLRRFGAWLVSEGYLPLNPYRNMKPKHNDAEKMKPFTAEQVKAVIDAIEVRSPMIAAYYEFLFLTGCRPAEAIGLLQGKASIAGESITIDSVLARGDDGSATAVGRVRKETKTGDVRVLPISDQIRRVLIKALEATGKPWDASALVFQNSKGGALDDTNLCDRYWKPALSFCGLPYQRPYVTRHTAASTVLENGGTLADAAKLLGHRDLRMVSTIYGHAIKSVQLPSYS